MLAYSTVATSDLIEMLAEEHPNASIAELKQYINYDEDAKRVIDAYITS